LEITESGQISFNADGRRDRVLEFAFGGDIRVLFNAENGLEVKSKMGSSSLDNRGVIFRIDTEILGSFVGKASRFVVDFDVKSGTIMSFFV